MTKKLKSGTPFVYDENDRVVGIRDPHTGTDTDLVTAVTSPGGGNRLLVGGQELIPIAVVQQGTGSDLPARPDAEIVHWHVHDYIAPDPQNPYDHVIPSGPLKLFERGTQGALHNFGNISAQGSTTELGGGISKLLDAGPRFNDAIAVGSWRPILSARVNLLPTTNTLSGWPVQAGGAGSLPVVTPAAGVAPDGTMTAVRVDLNAGDSGNVGNYSRLRLTHSSPPGTKYRSRIAYKAFSSNDVGKTIRIVHENVVSGGVVVLTLGAEWAYFDAVMTRSVSGTAVNYIIDQRGTFTSASASLLIAQCDLRYEGNYANVPPYQEIRADNDYDVDGFPRGALFDGTDDAMTVAAGGGGATGFFWCGAIRLEKIGAAQTLFSDTGANTGYRVRINASNQLELSAGNGSTYTSIATARALEVGERAVCTAWHDGANLYVQLDDGDIASTAFVTTTAGTAGYTIGKDNGAASSYFGGVLYAYIYLREKSLTGDERAMMREYGFRRAKITGAQ